VTVTTANPIELGQEPVDVKKPDEGDLRLWSVTTILGVLDKPALLYWAAEQTAKAAVTMAKTLPARVAEDGAENVVKYLRDARFRRAPDALSDAEFGTAMHGVAENYALTGIPPKITAETFKGDVDAAVKCFEQLDRWLQRFQPAYIATEVTVFSPTYGIAGTTDGFFTIDGVRLIFDYKYSKKSFDAQGKPTGLYPEVALQLAAYRHAEMAAVWRPRRFESFRRRYYALSTNEQGMAVPVPTVDGGLGIKVTPEHCTAYPVQCGADVYEAFLFCLEVARFQFEKSKSVIGDALVAPERVA
jgi:hypothetical protein